MVGSLSVIDGLISWLTGNLEAFAALLSSVASLGLVLLYRQQKNILKDQKEFLKLERLPEIQLADYTIDGNELEVEVSNYGHGLAKNIQYWTTVSAPESDRLEPLVMETDTQRLTTEFDQTYEQALNPNESRIIFQAEPTVAFELDGSPHYFANFSEAFEFLHQENITSVWFQVYLVAHDQLGGCQSKSIFSSPRNPLALLDSLEDESDQFKLEQLENWGVQPFLEGHPDFDVPSPDCRD